MKMEDEISKPPETTDRAVRLAWIDGLTSGIAGSIRRGLFDASTVADQLERIAAACAEWREDEYRRDRDAEPLLMSDEGLADVMRQTRIRLRELEAAELHERKGA